MKAKQKGSIAIQPQFAILRFAKYKGPEIGRIEAHSETGQGVPTSGFPGKQAGKHLPKAADATDFDLRAGMKKPPNPREIKGLAVVHQSNSYPNRGAARREQRSAR